MKQQVLTFPGMHADHRLWQRNTPRGVTTSRTGAHNIKGTRLTVEYILNLLAHGSSVVDILDEYEGLTSEDIQACLLFASQSLSSTAFMPLVAESA